jgi:hypothetical protein
MIIALSAWKGSGKDTVAKILVEERGFTRIAFADVLKDMVAEQYGISRESLDDQNQKERPILSLPANPQDDFSRMVVNYMLRELRTESGQIPNSLSDMPFWTGRALAILEGSVKRSVSSSYWLDRALKSTNANGNYVITDMRYQSEMNQIRDFAKRTEQPVMFVRINRFESSPSLDASERDLDRVAFDVVIENKTGLEDLRLKSLGLVD